MAIAAFLSLLIGVVLGMLGGGGAIMALPMLVYVAGVEPHAAIATSLFLVGATSIAGLAMHARAVSWRIGAMFGAAAMATAYLGGRLAGYVPAAVLMLVFAVLMVVAAAAMLRGQARREVGSLRPLHVLALGAGVGLFSGLVGAGGGFLIVPALTIFGGLELRKSIATSLFVIALQSFAGFAGHVAHVHIDWGLVLVITAAAVGGAVAGSLLGKRVSTARLRRGFAWLVLAMGAFVFLRQLPLPLAALAIALTLMTVLFVTRHERKTA